MNVEIVKFSEKEYINVIFVAVYAWGEDAGFSLAVAAFKLQRVFLIDTFL